MKTIQFISDQEIDLNKHDFLKTKVYADNLVDVINNTATDNVFTVGLYGSWGSGKSSIIETAKQSFDEKKDKVKFITYDAWQYSNDSFRRMFLRTLSKELNYRETDFMKRFYENESRDVDNEFKLSYTKSIYVLIGILVLLVILSFFDFQIVNKVTTFSILTVLGTLVALFSGVFHQFKVSVTKPYVFAPEQFEDCFKEIASKALKNNSLLDKLKYINDCDYTIKNLNKLVIVIDNIDRCNSEVAYQLLTDIKTFLGSQKFSIVFIIPVDDKALLKNFFSKSKSGFEHNDKEEFLRKIFNVTLRIKPYNSTDMFAFTKSICKAYRLNLKNETINIIGKEYSSNPRRVIQLINNLNVELNNYDDEFSSVNETIICCVLIIREEYPEFYDKVYNNSSILINYDYSSNEEDKNKKEVNRFMRIAESEFQHTKNSVLNQILMNTDNYFKEISAEVIEMVNTFDVDKLSKYLNENIDNKSIIYDFLCFKIDEAHDNDLKNDFSKYIEMIGVLNNIENLEISYLFKIFEKFKSKLEVAFYYSEKPDVLIDLVSFEAENINKYGLKNYLISLIISRSVDSNEDYKKRWIDIYNAVLIKLRDKETSRLISDDYYRKYKDLLNVKNLSDEQLKVILNDSFVTDMVNELDSLDIENEKYIDIKFILDKYENKLFVIERFFGKINTGGFFKNDTESRILYLNLFNDFIKTACAFTNNYNGNYIETNLDTIFKNVEILFKDQSNKTLSFLEIIKVQNKENKNLLFDVLKNYYSFTGKLNIIESYIIQLNQVIPNDVRKYIIELLDEEKDILFYYPELYKSFDLYDDNVLRLCEYYLNHNDDKFQRTNLASQQKITSSLLNALSDDKISNIINDILIKAIKNESVKDCIISVFNDKVSKNDASFFSFINLDLKKIYALELSEILNIDNIRNKDILSLCFEVDDSVINNKINQLLNDSNFSHQMLHQFLNEFIKLIELNKSARISSLIASIIIDKYEQKYIRSNAHTMKIVRDQFNSVRSILNIISS